MFVRWDEQRVENDLRLPGVGDGTVTRTFDAPEAMGVNFHEVRARSALNHVPGGRYGFSYTINQYRGCTHACVYCLAGETPILMADGTTRPLREIRVGDAVYGTVRRGSYRRYEITRVQAHWTTRKAAYRIVLEDGTELIASGDHRFLTNRGWKYVVGAEQGPLQRPHLTLNSKLMGVGALGPAVEESAEYRRGYLCGMIRLGVVAIEPLGRRIQMYDVTTGTGDFIANGVVSHNCFARRTHTYLDFDAGRDFEREIVVKVNVPELLRAELARPSWKRELVALGTNTDPYQWVESRYRMMPEILEALEAAATPVSVLTKSPLVMRDVEIFARIARRGLPVSVNLSVPTLDEDAWRATEPHTPSPSARLDAVAELRRRGIDSGVLIAPLMPGINDHPDQVRPIVERAKKAGATFLGGVALHLRDEVKDVFFAWLEAKRPDLLPHYEALYRSSSYMQPAQRKQTTRAVRGWGRNRLRSSLADRSPSPAGDRTAGPAKGDPPAGSRTGPPAPSAPHPRQDQLF
jgi:DNA repair photolyase